MQYVKHLQSNDMSLKATLATGLIRFEVLSVDGQTVYIKQSDDTQVLAARRAASCMLEPVAGDQVLVHVDGPDQPAYVIAVLERAREAQVASYRLSESICLVADPRQLKVQTPSLDITAEQGDFKIAHLNSVHREHVEQAESVSLVAGQATHQVGRFVAKLRDSFRLIEGLDRTQASNIDQSAQYQMSLDADITKINAQHVVKVQGKKIDLG